MIANWPIIVALALLVLVLILIGLLISARHRLKEIQASLRQLDEDTGECFRRLLMDHRARLSEIHAKLEESGQERYDKLEREFMALRKSLSEEMGEQRQYLNGEQRELRSLLNELLRVRV